MYTKTKGGLRVLGRTKQGQDKKKDRTKQGQDKNKKKARTTRTR